MTLNISIRSYVKATRRHCHPDFHQIVMPLSGSINISLHQPKVLVPGNAIVIKAGQIHSFSADEQAKFLVLDACHLSPDLLSPTKTVLRLNSALLSYLQFVEQLLLSESDNQMHHEVIELLLRLLQHNTEPGVDDRRIQLVLETIEHQLSQTLTIEQLASLACLSPSQFKHKFKQATGQSCMQYIAQLRMTKAKALLLFSDTPIEHIAERVGYQNQSAFGRKFKSVYGLSPRQFARQSQTKS